MIKINNYISYIQQSIIKYISSQQFSTTVSIITQFTKPPTSIKCPVISICFDKINITPIFINNTSSKTYQHKIDIDLSFAIYTPLKFTANICYDLFYDLANILTNNTIKIPFIYIYCDNIKFIKPVNCFSLIAHTPITVVTD